MIIETWKPLPGYGGHYEVSDHGQVRVKDRVIVKPHSQSGDLCEYHYKGRTLKRTMVKGYAHVSIGVDGVRTKLRVGRAVLLAFVGEPPEGYEACHGKGGSTDDRLTNLRWDTHFENNQDRLRDGTYARGVDHRMVKLDEVAVRDIRFGGVSFKAAKQKYGIAMSQYYRIRRGESWTHLKE